MPMSAAINIQIIEQLDRGISYAESCFETFRVIDSSIFLWDKHWQRLQLALQSFGITLDDSEQNRVRQHCLDAAQSIANDCLVRLSITGGAASWGLNATATPEVYIQALPFQKKADVLLKTVEYPFPFIPKPAKFTSDYALTFRAMQQWDTDSPLICKGGSIISGLTANIALFIDGKWLTPNGDGVLQGTIRQFFMDKGVMTAASCPTSILINTEAAVLLNAGSFVQVISHIDNQPLDTNHSAIQKLQQCLEKQDGVQL